MDTEKFPVEIHITTRFIVIIGSHKLFGLNPLSQNEQLLNVAVGPKLVYVLPKKMDFVNVM